jgi:uncharacterized protein (UPF0335 family)
VGGRVGERAGADSAYAESSKHLPLRDTGRRDIFAALIRLSISNREDFMADVGGIAGAQLRSYIERIERLEEEKAALAADIREVFAEAKATGFEPKVMRQIVRLRKLDQDDRQEQEALLELYLAAIGMGAGPEGVEPPVQ